MGPKRGSTRLSPEPMRRNDAELANHEVDGVGWLTGSGDDDVHFPFADEARRQGEIQLVEAGEGALRPSVGHSNREASDGGGDVLGTVEAAGESGGVEDEGGLLNSGADGDGAGYNFVTYLAINEPGDLGGGLIFQIGFEKTGISGDEVDGARNVDASGGDSDGGETSGGVGREVMLIPSGDA